MAKEKQFYVSNKALYAAMIKYKESVELAKTEGRQKPRVPEYIGSCIMLIGQKLSMKPNFRKYSYTEEMVGDGNLACIKYIDNFNPERSTNPFAYFTQFHINAFINRLNSEQKQQYVRARLVKDAISMLHEIPGAAVSAGGGELNETDPMNTVIESFERRQADKKQRAAEKAKEKASSADTTDSDSDDSEREDDLAG